VFGHPKQYALENIIQANNGSLPQFDSEQLWVNQSQPIIYTENDTLYDIELTRTTNFECFMNINGVETNVPVGSEAVFPTLRVGVLFAPVNGTHIYEYDQYSYGEPKGVAQEDECEIVLGTK
jgi:hypothetical protein